MSNQKTHYPNAPCFIYFSGSVIEYALPERFTFPFHYQPHPLSIRAAEELQNYIQQQTEWTHDFGLEGNKEGLGKMFGVLVVQNIMGELGYLAAFSGKLAGSNHWSKFVPPVFDMLQEDGFYRIGEEELNVLNRQIEALESNQEFIELKKKWQSETTLAQEQIIQLKQEIKIAKAERNIKREEAEKNLYSADFETLQAILNKESADSYYRLKDLSRTWKHRLETLEQQIAIQQSKINELKGKRKKKSAILQQMLFDNYSFSNQKGENKSLCDIFPISDNQIPPSGAGECAAPKLLQYAFKHQLTPIAMAEFWWGQSPSSEIRKHRQYYPACKSKCEPILSHMLSATLTDDNPLLTNPAIGKTLDIVYEDAFLVVVNKPAEFLSVPGKQIDDSVYSRMRDKYPDATGPLIVHRLDMSTSGLLLIAKSKEVHENLQSQFIKRRVKKRYTALLDGFVEADEGLIDLPIRVDLDNRPRQLVCYEHGKNARTQWHVVERLKRYTRVYFYPITGRTHQLRVHASHPKGLNTPIVGDDLYGNKADRLYLHAEALEFTHPISQQTLTIEVKAPF